MSDKVNIFNKFKEDNCLYYISLNSFTYQGKKNHPRPAIFQIEVMNIIQRKRLNSHSGYEGPFSSLKVLKSKSLFYKQLIAENSHWISKIFQEKYLVKIVDGAQSSKAYNDDFKNEILSILQHSVSGEIKNGQINGIHYYDSKLKNVRVIEEMEPDKNGVWKGTAQYFNQFTNEWKTKSSVSTFFQNLGV